MHDSPISCDNGLATAAAQAIDAGDPHAALAQYKAAIQQGKSNPTTLANYGVLLWRMFEFCQGEEVFGRVVEDPRADSATLQ